MKKTKLQLKKEEKKRKPENYWEGMKGMEKVEIKNIIIIIY